MSARTRRSLTLFWTALFVLSLILQYANFAIAPATVKAVHDEGLFELDGDAQNAGGTPGDDWDSHPGATGNHFIFINDLFNSDNDIGFTGGGSKDDLNTSAWQWIRDTVTPDKDDIEHAFAAAYESGGDTFVYFGLDKLAVNGDSNVGFWFFKNGIGLTGGPDSGGFAPVHSVGDLLVLSQFTNGGSVSVIDLYEWVGSGGDTNGTLDLLATGNSCTGAPAVDKACAVANTGPVPAPWSYTPKSGPANIFPTASFFEGGINLDDLFGGDSPCFSGFMADTRTSQSVDAVLKDVAVGNFNTCEPPAITTQVSQSTVNVGESVTDLADLSGNSPLPTGTIDFYLCGPSGSNPDCTSGGVKLGATKTLSGGTATSDPFTADSPSDAGHYCFRAVYTPDAAGANHYVGGSHTNLTTECFEVILASIDVEKTANPAGPVSAGASIGFDITVTNAGPGTASGVSLTDPLPAGVDWTLGAVTGDTTGVSCAINGAVGSEVLSCTDASMASGESFSVHVSATTDAADCGTISNTASVTTSNDGSDSDGASVVVQCPDVTVAKTPDGADINAGEDAVFTIVVTNLGPGSAANVTLTDNLPAGFTWTLGGPDAASCSIDTAPNPDVLSCDFGTLASGATRTITLTAPTDSGDCGTIPNAVTVGASNEAAAQGGNNSDTGSIDVLCAEIDIVKDANPVGPVNAGDDIGWDVTVTNNGAGAATDVSVSDNLPAGVDWTLGAVTGDTTGVSCAINGAVGSEILSCTDASMAAGDSFTVHLSGSTDAADCGTIDNTATVTTGNDGSGSDGASVVVNCPDLEVVKSGNGPLNAGDTATFTISLTNHGPGDAYDVTLSDQLPAGTWTLGGADAADCSIDGSNLLTCDFGTVASGDSRTITVSKETTPDDCGTIPNEVTVGASNEPANDVFPNTDAASIVVNCPDLTVSKTGNGTVSAGEVVTFSITVENLGPGAASDVTLDDPLPPGIDWTLDSVTGDTTGVSCAINGAVGSEVLSCADASMAAGDSFTVNISGESDAADCGTIPNTATVAGSNEAEEDTANNEASDSVVVNCPLVVITKTADDAVVDAGDQIGFVIEVTNTGDGSAFNVTVSDTLPTQAGLSWTIDAVNSSPGWSINAGVLSFGPATLAGGASTHVHLVSPTTAASCGEVPNLASVTYDGGSGSDDSSVTVLCPDVVVIKSASNSPIVAGDDAVFAITVSNEGEGTAKDVVLTDNLPAGVDWSLGSVDGDTAGVSCDITGAVGSEVLTCTDASMAAGDSFTVHVSGETDRTDCGAIPNLASASAGNEAEGDTGNNSDDATIDVRCPTIDLDKSHDDADGVVGHGQTVTYTIIVTVADGPVTNAIVTDELPEGQTYVDGSQSSTPAETGFAISPDGRTLSWAYASLDSGATITYDVTIDAGAPVGDQTNIAEVCVSEVPDCASDDATVTVPDLTILKSFTGNTGGDFNGTPVAKIGDVLTYTLTYDLTNGPVHNGVITDTLPVGLAYVDGSATGNAEFSFDSFDAATRTLTWTAPLVSADGSVTYQVLVLEGADELVQPLVNVATIDSDETDQDDDSAEVLVAPPPQQATATPKITLPPTSTIDVDGHGTPNPGFSLMLVLLGLAGLVLAIGFVTPVPERIRRRERRR